MKKQLNKNFSTYAFAGGSVLIVFALLIVFSRGIYIACNNINVSIGSGDKPDNLAKNRKQ